jgi:hypothetical protein
MEGLHGNEMTHKKKKNAAAWMRQDKNMGDKSKEVAKKHCRPPKNECLSSFR